MSALQARVEAMRQQSARQAEQKRASVRESMPADMLAFADQMRDEFGATLTYLKTPTMEVGKPGERGCSDFCLPMPEKAEKAVRK